MRRFVITLKGGDYMRKVLKMLRAKYDYTQREMAMRLGVSRTTYCNIENGRSKGTMTFWLGVIIAFPESENDVMTILKERSE